MTENERFTYFQQLGFEGAYILWEQADRELDKIFDMVVKIRKNTQIPMVFMTYANVVYSYGTERFVKKAAETGMDGLILPAVPFEEKKEYEADAPDQVKAYVKDMCEAVHRG